MSEFWLYSRWAKAREDPAGPGPSYTVISVGGDLDMASAPLLDEHLFTVLVQRGPYLALELSELTFLDSSGLNVMINYWKQARECGGGLQLIAAPRHVTAMLARTGLDRYLTRYPNVVSLLNAPVRPLLRRRPTLAPMAGNLGSRLKFSTR